MKNTSVINASHNFVVLLPTSGNRARNTLSPLADQPQRSSASPVLRHRINYRYHCRDAIAQPAKRPRVSDKCSLPPCPAV